MLLLLDFLPEVDNLPCKQKPVKNLGEKGAWAYPGTAKIFPVPLLSQERLELRTSNLARIFTGFIPAKAF